MVNGQKAIVICHVSFAKKAIGEAVRWGDTALLSQSVTKVSSVVAVGLRAFPQVSSVSPACRRKAASRSLSSVPAFLGQWVRVISYCSSDPFAKKLPHPLIYVI